LASNVTVAFCKYAGAFCTNSGSALAEAIHSSADCLNQFGLLLGRRSARALPDEQHPPGFGRETYFYGMLVALQIFLIGGVASAAVGVWHLMHRSPLEHPYVVIGVLCASGVIEAFALRASIGTIKPRRRKHGLLYWFRESGKPEVMLSVGEDAAALAGVAVSLLAVGIAVLTGNPAYDALGGIGVGLVLMGTAFFAMREIKSLLIGESAHADTRNAMYNWIAGRSEVTRIVSVVVLKWADDLVVAVQAELEPQGGADDLVRTINSIENDLRAQFQPHGGFTLKRSCGNMAAILCSPDVCAQRAIEPRFS
jgi:divalent metal cation (Fe/Co/Zn/Cd) transporter